MDTKSKDSPKTKDILRQMQSELRQLQEAMKNYPSGEAVREAADSSCLTASKTNWVVQLTVKPREEDGKASKLRTLSYSEADLSHVTHDSLACLGSAVSSAPKVALLRVLLSATDGESAAALGSAAGLSTGSLYHHLHDLSHAGLISQETRNHYTLTGYGRSVLLTLMALSMQKQGK